MTRPFRQFSKHCKTIFDLLGDLRIRVEPVGRLDMDTEGALLLTNDGEVKRKLELPSTGWLRKYRVRVNGRPTDAWDLLYMFKSPVKRESKLQSYVLNSSRKCPTNSPPPNLTIFTPNWSGGAP